VITDQLIQQQFRELVFKFNKLVLEKRMDGEWQISGILGFTGDYSGKLIEDEYSILITLSKDYPQKPPQAWETGNRIPSGFHKYTNGLLCLGAPLAVIATFYEEPTLSGFVHNCLIPYLYSYSFYSLYGSFPFGELSHGPKGIYDYYKELFHVEENRAILKLIRILAEDNYRGHLPCACGSGKRLRSCHGPQLRKIKLLQSPLDFLEEYKLLSR
jgi:hypothetical protein